MTADGALIARSDADTLLRISPSGVTTVHSVAGVDGLVPRERTAGKESLAAQLFASPRCRQRRRIGWTAGTFKHKVPSERSHS